MFLSACLLLIWLTFLQTTYLFFVIFSCGFVSIRWSLGYFIRINLFEHVQHQILFGVQSSLGVLELESRCLKLGLSTLSFVVESEHFLEQRKVLVLLFLWHLWALFTLGTCLKDNSFTFLNTKRILTLSTSVDPRKFRLSLSHCSGLRQRVILRLGWGLSLRSRLESTLLSFDFFFDFDGELIRLWVFCFLLRSMLFLLLVDFFLFGKDGGNIEAYFLIGSTFFALIVQKFLGGGFQSFNDELYDFFSLLLFFINNFFRESFWVDWSSFYLFRLILLLWKIVESLLNLVSISSPSQKINVQTMNESSGRRSFDLWWRNVQPAIIKLLKIDKKLFDTDVFAHSFLGCFALF